MASQETPCPECNYSTPAGQPACVACGASLLVSVVLAGPVGDARTKFALAKALAALPPPGRTFAQIQAALSASHPVLAQDVTLALAHRYLDEAGRAGVQAFTRSVQTIARSAPPASAPRSGPSFVAKLAGLVLAVVCFAGAWFLTQLVRGARRDAPEISRATTGPSTETVQRAIRSTVAVRCNESRAAGFFISSIQLLTNAHAVCPDGQMMQIVLHDGRKLLGKTMRKNEKLDLALVEVAGGEGVPLELTDATLLQSGDPVVAIGSPQGLEFTVSRGTVSYVGRTMVGVGYLQIDINVNPGNSGGPVVDGMGRVVGVLSMMMKDANGLGLALPINYAFDGPDAMAAAPANFNPEQWRQLRSKVSAADDEDAVTAKAAFERPGLVGALLKSNGSLVAMLLVRSEGTPSEAAVEVELDNGEAGRCSGHGFPVRWQRVTNFQDRKLPDPRLAQWLRDHQLTEHLWVGMQNTTLSCARQAVPAHSVLKLKGGHQALEKAIVRAATDDLLIVESASARAPATAQEAARQSEHARAEAETIDAQRTFSACAEHAKNLGANVMSMCADPYRRLQKLQQKSEELKRLIDSKQ